MSDLNVKNRSYSQIYVYLFRISKSFPISPNHRSGTAKEEALPHYIPTSRAHCGNNSAQPPAPSPYPSLQQGDSSAPLFRQKPGKTDGRHRRFRIRKAKSTSDTDHWEHSLHLYISFHPLSPLTHTVESENQIPSARMCQ